MDVSIIYKNLLKVFIICLSVVSLSATQLEAQYFTPEQEAALQARADRNKEIREWYNQKKKALKLEHPTAEEKKLIEEGKKEWDEKSKTMTNDEYVEAYDKWANGHIMAWTKLDPATSSNDDVKAASSADYVWSEIEEYADSLEGQAEESSKKEQENTDGVGEDPEKFEDIPIDDSSTSTSSDATTGTAEAPASSGAGPKVEPEIPTNITQTVTQNNNGNVTQETTSNAVQSSTGGTGTGTDSNVAADEDNNAKVDDVKTDNKENEDEKKKEEEKKAEEEVKYTGIYKDRQLIPDAMAVHCEMNAEDVVKDMSRLEGCMRKYITDMNNANAAEAAEGKRVYNILRFNVLSDAIKKGIAKAAAVNGYENAMNNYAEASANAETKFDSEANISNTLAFAIDVQNSIRDIYVEDLRIMAVNGFGEVDPSSFVDDKKSEKAKEVEEGEKKSTSQTTKVETKVQIGGDEENIDSAGADEAIVDGGELPEVVVGNQGEGSSAAATDGSQNAGQTTEQKTAEQTAPKSEYEQKLANMSDKELTEEEYRIKKLEIEYAEYIATQKDGHGWEVEPERLAEWKNAGKMAEQVLQEQMRRRR